MERLKNLKYIEVENHDGWLEIIISNQKKRNALSSKLVDEMIRLFAELKVDENVRGIIIQGKNNIFCSGADLDELRKIAYEKEKIKELTINMSENIGKLLKMIHEAPQVTVSVVDGPCIAGGFGMACAADILITMDSSYFKLSETKLGLIPSQISPYLLNRMTFSKARQLMLLGDDLDGSTAHSIGVADYLAHSYEDLYKVISQIKSKVMLCSPNAIAKTKSHLSKARNIDIQRSSQLFFECINHDEGLEGLQSFFEKRDPYWAKSK